MRRTFVLMAVTAVVAVLVTGCSDDPETPVGPGGGPGVVAPTGPSTSGPSTPPPPEAVLAGMAQAIRISDADDDAKRTRRCFTRTPTAPACGEEVSGLALSSEALVLQLGRFRDLEAPPEVGDLYEQTFALAEDVRDRALEYEEACPEGGATSQECVDQLEAVITEVGNPLVEVMKGWKPYL